MKNDKINERRNALKKIGAGIGMFISMPVIGSFLNSCEQEEGAINPKQDILEFNINDYTELLNTGGSARLSNSSNTIFIIAVRISESEIKTFSSLCTHQGCMVNLPQNLEKMICPCHNSQFSPIDGSVLKKPNDGSDISALNEFSNEFNIGSGDLKIFLS